METIASGFASNKQASLHPNRKRFVGITHIATKKHKSLLAFARCAWNLPNDDLPHSRFRWKKKGTQSGWKLKK